jgi:hypothetical protein
MDGEKITMLKEAIKKKKAEKIIDRGENKLHCLEKVD